ncbi:hypothetical protein NQ317_003556 [Molorchus minor]|uniref:DRBM domain-containing protein n=1 Tax=Molorchus minor TaxID=1323400 RepID=A0ABQ9ISK7_9CUCU|nr:hypothetical protein NQ317_003556 [Molorchus minor]
MYNDIVPPSNNADFKQLLIILIINDMSKSLVYTQTGPLKDICLENKIPDPIFTPVSDVGPPHSREFTFECSIASIKTVATGSTKKMAKQMAAKMMLERKNIGSSKTGINPLPQITK